MSNDRNTSEMFLAFGAGALLGAAAALLLAPKSGRETRRDIRRLAGDAVDRSRELADQVKAKTHETTDAAGRFIRDQKERVGHALHEGKEAYMREASKS